MAKHAGVSINAVSSVINQSRVGTRVSEETRRRIQKAAAELQYHPNAAARRLSGKQMNTLGVIFYRKLMSPFSSAYFTLVLDGIMEAAAQHKQDTMMFTRQRWEDAQHSLSVFCDGRCDGLLLVGAHTATDIVPALLDRQMPFVLVNNRWEHADASWVDVDDIEAGRQMTAYLLTLGHRRIAMLCGDSFVQCVPRRLEGYRQAFADAGLTVDPDLVLPGSFVAPSTAQRVAALMQLPANRRPTALFCTNDQMAVEALEMLAQLGVRVPQEISIVGFDDIPVAAAADPPLTTVRQPLTFLGSRAVELLLTQIEDQNAPGIGEIYPTELIVRQSCAPV